MSFYIAVGAVVLWFLLAEVVKQLHQNAKERWEERVMADYHRAADARYHRNLLVDIEAQRRATAEELIRTAQEASGEVIEGTAFEIAPARRRRT